MPVILIDSKEKNEYNFLSIRPNPSAVITGLKTGDYSIDGFEDSGISIERKSIPDLFQSLGKGREREERKFQRLSEFHRKYLVIDGDWNDIFYPPPYTMMNPKSVWETIHAWSIKYDVGIIFGKSRKSSQELVFKYLENYWIYFGGGIRKR